MIESLRIKNFQSHKDTEVDFAPGVNVIIGSSDSGKTAIIRALRWVAWNRPLGDSMKSHWGGDTKVMVKTTGAKITRFKGKGGDRYELDSIEEPFVAFGTEPPEEIKQAINFSELNLQSQMDSPFLLSSNPGEVSRHFNRIANIDQIDSSLKAVESWVRSINQDVKATESEIERQQETLKDFEYLDKMEAEVEVLEQMDSARSQTRNQIQKLTSLLSSLETVEKDMEEAGSLLPMESTVNSILALYDQRLSLRTEYKELKDLCKRLVDLFKDLKAYKALTKVEKPLNLILGLYNKSKEQDTKYKRLDTLIGFIEDTSQEIIDAETELNVMEQQWHQSMPDVCPLCGQETK